MSLKPGNKKQKNWFTSLATRMTLWYSFSAFAMVLTATGFLYQALSSGLAKEDDTLLSQNIRILAVRLQEKSDEMDDLKLEMQREWPPKHPVWLWIRVLDGSNRLVVESPGMDKILPVSFFPKPLSQEEEKGKCEEVLSAQGTPFRVLTAQSSWPGHIPALAILQVAVDMTSDAEILAKFRDRLWGVLGLSFLACIWAGYWIAYRGIRPVREMGNTAAKIGSTTLHERLETVGLPLELSELAISFNDMLNRLEDSFARLSQFSSDIAHELRTPLQNLRVEVEVVLRKDRSTVEYRDLLGSCLEEYRRLSNLIDRLLFLARAENPETKIQCEKVNLKREFEILLDFYELSAGESGIQLETDVPDDLKIDADRSLLQRAVGNLVENALKHTPANGKVRLSAIKDGKKIRLEISDTGHGIPEDQLPKVFDRFYRVDESRTPTSGGAGLGLSIVKSIMDLHGGSVQIQSKPNQGTTVILLFPTV